MDYDLKNDVTLFVKGTIRPSSPAIDLACYLFHTKVCCKVDTRKDLIESLHIEFQCVWIDAHPLAIPRSFKTDELFLFKKLQSFLPDFFIP
jgi:hypothetical protein